MEGLQILNQTEIIEYPGWWCWALVVSAFMPVCSIGIISDRSASKIAQMIACFTAILGLLGLVVVLGGDWKKPTGQYKYEAIISDDVSITSLYEKYEVVEQRGEIWVLKDKETGVEP